MPEFVGRASPLTEAGVTGFLTLTGSAAPEMWAVLAVETSGCGFLPDKRPKILFERHIFHALTRGLYDQSHPDISQPTAGGYGLGGANQYNRLAEAVALDRTSALKSASWGIGQLMGMNFALGGFTDVETMVTAMSATEDTQLGAMAQFVEAKHLAGPLARQDWTGFALGYNGADYAKNNYDGQLRQFYGRYRQGPLPDLRTRTVQVGLIYAGLDPKGIDGQWGPGTKAAIIGYQTQNDLEPTGEITDALVAALFPDQD